MSLRLIKLSSSTRKGLASPYPASTPHCLVATILASLLLFVTAAQPCLGQVGKTDPPPKPADKASKDKAEEKAEKKVDAGQENKDQDKQPAADEKAANEIPPIQVDPLIQGVLKRMFGRPNRMRGIRASQRAQDDKQSDRDYIDGRAPHDVKVEQVMRAAETAIRGKDWKPALELLQRLLDQPEDSLHRLPDGRWESVRRIANQLLDAAPPEVQRDYETQFSGLARQLLTDAQRSGRTADYVNVATRFLHTSAGAEAANYLGSLHLDRGEFGLAAARFTEIPQTAAFANSPAWRTKVAFALRQAGDSEAADAFLKNFDDSSNKPVLGTGTRDAVAWLRGIASLLPAQSANLSEWLQLYGSAARTGTATGGEPLLSPLWSIPLTSSHPVRRRLNWILQDLLDQDRTPLLACLPLVEGGRVIYRDLRGMRVVDIESGNTIWESAEGVSAERMIGGLPPLQAELRDAWRLRVNQFQVDQNEYQGQSAEYHPLAGLLFRDGIYGILSSDGTQVFVIEDHGILTRNQPGHQWGWDGSTDSQDNYGVSWSTNRLVSYDLKTGRPRWSVGGLETQESFDLPLAGSFFYGTPAVDGDELFVVAGKGDDIRLWSLDRATGAPLWSQLIAYTDTKIEQDLGRRWFSAQVASEGGIVVCPTSVGWLVAVDRMRQGVLWAHRYLPPSGGQDRDQGTQYIPQRDLNSQWAPSAPVIAGNVVVYTPPEEPIILGLNMQNGRKLWEKPKESWQYLAGVFGDRVILVGNYDVEALQLSTGETQWKSSLGDCRPSGRGLAVGDQFYLPLNNGELRVLDLKTGRTQSRTYVSSAQPPLGNLAMHQGKLVSLGPQGLYGFGQRAAVIEEIKQRKSQNPNDPWAMLREAEIHLLNRDYTAALPLLKSLNSDGLSDTERKRAHQDLIQCLAAVFRQDRAIHAAELETLGRVATSPDEKRLHQELSADHLIAKGQFKEAFDMLWSLRTAADTESLIPRADDPEIALSYPVWLGSRLKELWDAAANNRELIDTQIKDVAAAAAKANTSERRLVARLISFHPASIPLRQSIVEELDFGRAQIELLDLSEYADRPVAARAMERLAKLMEQFGLTEDASYYHRVRKTEFQDVPLEEGSPSRLETKPAPKPTSIWDERPLQMVQGPMPQVPPTQEIATHSRLPFFEPLNLAVQQQEQRLTFESVANNQFTWIAPLRSSPRNQGDGYVAAEFLGHQMVLTNRDVLHVFSPVEKRLLWSKTLDTSGEGGPFWQHASRAQPLPMVSASHESENQLTLLQSAAYRGRLAVVQPNYLCIYGRRSFSVLDPQSGDLLWRKDGIAQYSHIVGSRDMLFVVPQDRSKSEAFRVSDGKPVTIDNLGNLLGNTLLMKGECAVLLEQKAAIQAIPFFNSPKAVIRLYQPLTKEERWRYEYPSRTLVSVLDSDTLLTLAPDGKAEQIDVATGKRDSLAQLLPADMKSSRKEVFAIMDDTHIFLVINVHDTMGYHHYGESLPSMRANGVIYAWKRSDGTRAWRQEIKQQNLVVDHFRTMPVLVFVSRSWKQKGNTSYATLSIQAIHKQTGKQLHESETPTMYSGFHSVDVNYSEPAIELKSYNLRLRLVPNGEVKRDAAIPEKTSG